MKNPGRTSILIIFCLLGTVLFWTVCPHAAWAAEKVSAGRKLWDNIMLFFNFGILVFFFVKYGRKPLMAYLRRCREEIGDHLGRINGQLEGVKKEVAQEAGRLEDIEQHITTIKETILEMGRKEKAQIIEEGRAAAEKMIRDAEDYARYRMVMARKTLADELVDRTVALVEETLKKGISEDDHDRLVARFVGDLEGGKKGA